MERVVRGDVVIVPKGTPHWFKQVDGAFLYYVVKVLLFAEPVIAEIIPVIRSEDDHRVRESATGFEGLPHPPQVIIEAALKLAAKLPGEVIEQAAVVISGHEPNDAKVLRLPAIEQREVGVRPAWPSWPTGWRAVRCSSPPRRSSTTPSTPRAIEPTGGFGNSGMRRRWRSTTPPTCHSRVTPGTCSSVSCWPRPARSSSRVGVG